MLRGPARCRGGIALLGLTGGCGLGLRRPAGLKSNVREVADARHITHAPTPRKHKNTDRSGLLTFSSARL
ncbi:hypothetical protein [Azospirillum melinis]